MLPCSVSTKIISLSHIIVCTCSDNTVSSSDSLITQLMIHSLWRQQPLQETLKFHETFKERWTVSREVNKENRELLKSNTRSPRWLQNYLCLQKYFSVSAGGRDWQVTDLFTTDMSQEAAAAEVHEKDSVDEWSVQHCVLLSKHWSGTKHYTWLWCEEENKLEHSWNDNVIYLLAMLVMLLKSSSERYCEIEILIKLSRNAKTFNDQEHYCWADGWAASVVSAAAVNTRYLQLASASSVSEVLSPSQELWDCSHDDDQLEPETLVTWDHCSSRAQLHLRVSVTITPAQTTLQDKSVIIIIVKTLKAITF